MMKRITLTLLLLFTALCVSGQTLEELRKQAAALQEEMRLTNQLLSKTEGDQKSYQSRLRLTLNNISTRKKIVSTLDSQIALINREANAKSLAINQMESDLTELKQEYGTLVRAAYKSQQNNNVLAFLFASEDFNDVTQRVFYIKRYTAMRERKAEQIDSLSQVLKTDIAALALKRDSLNQTVQSRNQELNKLGQEEQDYRRTYNSLTSEVRNYRNQITQQQRQIKALQDQIQRIIAEEARKSQTAQRSTAEEEAFVLLTGKFDQNKGKLPYPVSGGVIVEKYGSHPHPTERGVTVNNKGVNIAAERGASVRAVFEGEVVRVFFTPGANNTVMIRHGNYFTTYSNLETVTVKAGDKVSINQNVGKIYSGTDSGNYILPFTIWNGTQTQNPELWLKR